MSKSNAPSVSSAGSRSVVIRQSFHSNNDENLFRNSDMDSDLFELDGSTRMTYCYLCSIKAHEHHKTEPIPIHKRRFLKPYMNPMQLLKRYDQPDPNSAEQRMKYTFLVKTGQGPTAGTNANVWFKLFGSLGTWAATELKEARSSSSAVLSSTAQRFPSDSLVKLHLSGPVVGEPRKLKIWREKSTARDGWLLEYVEIAPTGRKENAVRFMCNQWLAVNRSPNFTDSVLLTRLTGRDVKSANATEYIVLVRTVDRALNVDNVKLTLNGSKASSHSLHIDTPAHLNLFEREHLDSFLIMSSHDLGKPDTLKFTFETEDFNEREQQQQQQQKQHPVEWIIESISVIYSKEPNKIYAFRVEQWQPKKDKYSAVIVPHSINVIDGPIESTLSKKMVYHITVITGNVKFAGTDAHVFIELKGSRGKSNIHRLHNTKAKKEFERGQMDHFHIFEDDIGQLKTIRIWHDNRGAAPGWFLDAVLIRPISTTITGSQEKHQFELITELDTLRKKFRIREGIVSAPSAAEGKKYVKRAKSAADLSKIRSRSPSGERTSSADSLGRGTAAAAAKKRSGSSTSPRSRSSSAININDLLRTKSPSPSSSSILKKSPSPRTRNEMMQKRVKFNAQNMYEGDKGDPSTGAPKSAGDKGKQTRSGVDISLNWIMSVVYDERNTVTSVRTVEDYDKSIRNISKAAADKLDAGTEKKQSVEINQNDESSVNNRVYVFECRQWLAKDMDDKKTEKTLQASNVLLAK